MVKMSSHNFFNHHLFFQLKHKFNIIRCWSKFHGQCAEYLNEMKKRNCEEKLPKIGIFVHFFFTFVRTQLSNHSAHSETNWKQMSYQCHNLLKFI